MTRKNNKMQISIYQISDSHKKENESWDEVIGRLFATNSKYKPQKLKNSKYKSYKIRLYVCNEPSQSPSKVINFYEPIVEQGEALFETKKRDVSTMMFIYNDAFMFAVTTGFSHTIVRNYADSEFGLKIMSSLIGEYDNIKSISDKGVIGSIIANTRYFRGKYNWSDEDDFGKLFKEICAKLPPSAFIEKLGFSEEEIKKNITCIGTTTFRINKAISIDRLFDMVIKVENVLKSSKNIFNSMIPIYNRGADKEKYNALTNTLIEQIYNNMKTGKKSEFDISHPEFDVFYKADSYNIKYNDMKLYTRNIENIDSLDFLCEMQSREVAPMKTIDEFKKTFAKIQIYSYSFEDRELTYGTLLKHINGELKYDDKTYFIIDGQWLELKDEFKERLNRECKDYLSKYYNNALITAKWPNSSKKTKMHSLIYFVTKTDISRFIL